MQDSLNQWIPADHLKTGDRLKTASGTPAVADGGTAPKVHDGWMWDLTVPGNNDHDFYVLVTSYNASSQGYLEVTDGTFVLVHNDCLPALNGWRSQRYQFGDEQFLLDKSDMTHILTRHAPAYWNGSAKASQSFFDSNMSISDIQEAIGTVLRQNRGVLISRGATGIYQIQGEYDGTSYVLGLNRGHIGQFYPGELP
jgi:hypothetical protein